MWNCLFTLLCVTLLQNPYGCQICEIFTFWFLFAVNYDYQHMGVNLDLFDAVFLYSCSRPPYIYLDGFYLVLSPSSNFDKIEKMATITICAFIKNDISGKVIELETSFWCQTICF